MAKDSATKLLQTAVDLGDSAVKKAANVIANEATWFERLFGGYTYAYWCSSVVTVVLSSWLLFYFCLDNDSTNGSVIYNPSTKAKNLNNDGTIVLSTEEETVSYNLWKLSSPIPETVITLLVVCALAAILNLAFSIRFAQREVPFHSTHAVVVLAGMQLVIVWTTLKIKTLFVDAIISASLNSNARIGITVHSSALVARSTATAIPDDIGPSHGPDDKWIWMPMVIFWANAIILVIHVGGWMGHHTDKKELDEAAIRRTNRLVKEQKQF